MNRTITDQEHQLIIATYFNQIENAIKTARIHMTAGADGRPEIVDYMFEFIGQLAKHGQQFKWPDPAKVAHDARQDAALQQLLKRASKPTPIRATGSKGAPRTAKGGAQ
jgi:hypothetical protein